MYMATLSFTNNGDKWVAEQQVNADYALHIERKAGGGFSWKDLLCDAVGIVIGIIIVLLFKLT